MATKWAERYRAKAPAALPIPAPVPNPSTEPQEPFDLGAFEATLVDAREWRRRWAALAATFAAVNEAAAKAWAKGGEGRAIRLGRKRGW